MFGERTKELTFVDEKVDCMIPLKWPAEFRAIVAVIGSWHLGKTLLKDLRKFVHPRELCSNCMARSQCVWNNRHRKMCSHSCSLHMVTARNAASCKNH